MKSKIVYTNIKNIDFNNMKVVDNSQIKTAIYDSYGDVFMFEDINTKKRRKDTLIHVSLFNDLIVIGEEKFKILHMLSKENF
jgi:hypothetical protein